MEERDEGWKERDEGGGERRLKLGGEMTGNYEHGALIVSIHNSLWGLCYGNYGNYGNYGLREMGIVEL